MRRSGMPFIVDARGLECPEPAMRTGKALRDNEEGTVIVDDETAVKNISTGVTKRGHTVEVEQKGKDFYLHIKRMNAEPVSGKELPPYCTPGETVVFFASDTICRGNDEFGGILANSLIYSFLEVEPKPDTIIFMKSGVKLVIEGSKAQDDVKKLADRGVQVFACGRCLDFFGLKEKLAVGTVSNAYTIAETLPGAGKVVRF